MNQSIATPQARQIEPTKKPGFFTTLLWHTPWRIIGILLVSLLISIVIEFIGIAFIWPEQGAEHSKQVMEIELGYFSTEFKQSLFLSSPITTLENSITISYRWLSETGFIHWLQSQQPTDNLPWVTNELTVGKQWLIQTGYKYLMATVYVTLIFLIRVTILILSLPLFFLVAILGIVDGMVRRDIRRYGAAYESSFLYHHAKRFIKPAMYIPCVIYLSAPFAIYPNFLLLPAALITGLAISVMMGSFKKYL